MNGQPEAYDTVTRAANIAIDAAGEALEVDDAVMMHALLILHGEKLPEGESNACLAAQGFADDLEILEALVAHLQKIADGLGLELRMIAVGGDE